MNFLLIRVPILILSLIFLASCSTNRGKVVTQMEFNVDSTLVNRRVSDSSLSISYSVPGSWEEIVASDSALKQVNAANIRVSEILKNPAGTVVFSLTDVRKVQDSVFSNMDENYRTVLNPSGSWKNIERAEFITAGYNVKQYVMSRDGQAFFKMLFGDRTRPVFQVDYTVMIDSAYALNAKTFESIIGSLKRDH